VPYASLGSLSSFPVVETDQELIRRIVVLVGLQFAQHSGLVASFNALLRLKQ
jgi:hypothetical protein